MHDLPITDGRDQGELCGNRNPAALGDPALPSEGYDPLARFDVALHDQPIVLEAPDIGRDEVADAFMPVVNAAVREMPGVPLDGRMQELEGLFEVPGEPRFAAALDDLDVLLRH